MTVEVGRLWAQKGQVPTSDSKATPSLAPQQRIRVVKIAFSESRTDFSGSIPNEKSSRGVGGKQLQLAPPPVALRPRYPQSYEFIQFSECSRSLHNQVFFVPRP